MKTILVYGMTANTGGIESYVMGIYRNMDKKEFHFDFVTADSSIAYQTEILQNQSQVYCIPPKGRHPFKSLRAFYKILKAHPEYEKIYFNLLSASESFFMLVAKMARRKIIAHSHNGYVKRRWLHKLLRPYLNKVSDYKFACSKRAAAFMFGSKQVRKKGVIIIHNTIDTELFSYNEEIRKRVRDELNLEKKIALCYVGRLCYQKNPIELIDIFEEIYEKDNNAVLLVIGTGEMEKEVICYAAEKKSNKNIYFLGVIADVNEILQGADIFVLPSRFEGFPIVGIEAQAAGLPCLFSETITREVNIVGENRFLPIRIDNHKMWVEEYEVLKKKDRTDTSTIIKEKGYDISLLKDRGFILYECFRK